MNALLISASLMLTACSPAGVEVQSSKFPVMPDGLKDCKMFYLKGEGGTPILWVTRCPNSSTTTSDTAKGGLTASAIEGAPPAPPAPPEPPKTVIIEGRTYELKP
jgi:hypothetical protein